jgi:hypothetical protein
LSGLQSIRTGRQRSGAGAADAAAGRENKKTPSIRTKIIGERGSMKNLLSRFAKDKEAKMEAQELAITEEPKPDPLDRFRRAINYANERAEAANQKVRQFEQRKQDALSQWHRLNQEYKSALGSKSLEEIALLMTQRAAADAVSEWAEREIPNAREQLRKAEAEVQSAIKALQEEEKILEGKADRMRRGIGEFKLEPQIKSTGPAPILYGPKHM